MTALERECPTCGTRLPVVEGYVTWCHQCGWNLAPPKRHELGQGRLERLYAAAGKRLGDRLAESLATEDRLRPRLTVSKAAAYALAGAVYAFAVGAVVGGIVLAVLAFPNPFALVGSAVLVGTGILMRPRLGKPPDEGLVERSQAPTLHDLVDRVASALGTPSVDLLAVEHDFNASWAVLGVRRRRVLTLGLPLLTAVGPQERVALVAHELAHARNGDATRGLFVGSAVRALAELYWLLSPEELSGELDWDLGIFERIVNGFLWIVSRPVYGLLLLELHLLMRDTQRAEYLADALATDVAGTDAAVALQEKLLLEATFRSAVKQASRPGRNGERDVFALLSEAVAGVPPRERERRRRVARLEGARLSDSHPPTAKRIDLLERRPKTAPRVVLDEAASARIDAELASLRTAYSRRLVDEYRDTLYAG